MFSAVGESAEMGWLVGTGRNVIAKSDRRERRGNLKEKQPSA